ncbi:MAG: prepilin peptidase, partial [Nitrosospira sp.]
MSFIYLLQSTPFFFVSFCSIIGLMVGSFLNVVIHRLPKMLEKEWGQQCAQLHGETVEAPSQKFNLFLPGSACPHCGHKITALENIPV